MARVSNILEGKGHDVFSVHPDTTAYEALQILADKNIGALVVCEGDQCMGIFSERDYARRVILKGRASKETTIREIMTENPYTVTEEDTIEECMLKMTDKRIRHLPVVNDHGVLIGLISIGDVVKYVIDEQRRTILNLESYIHGTHY